MTQEELSGSGKRSRNPSTSSGYGARLGGYRSRRASEGDEGAGGGRGGGSRGGSRHNSGGVSKPYRGRHSDHSDHTDSWVISSSYQVSLILPLKALPALITNEIVSGEDAAETGIG